MKRGAALVALALAALILQGMAGLSFPGRWVPDFGLLVVVGVALSLRSGVAGVLFAALVGYATDLFSGALLGQHMLLRIGSYGAARAAAAGLNLRGPLAQMIFILGLSLVHSVALWGLVAFVSPEVSPPLGQWGDLLTHALVNALVAPFVCAGVAWLVARLGDDETAGRLALAPRKRTS